MGDSFEIKELKAKEKYGLLNSNFIVLGYFDLHNLVQRLGEEDERVEGARERDMMMMKEREEGPK